MHSFLAEVRALKVRDVFLGFVFATLFSCVLFLELFSLPLASYDLQRFILVGLLAIKICLFGCVFLAKRGIVAVGELWPVLLIAASYLLLAIPFDSVSHNWVESAMYAAFFVSFVLTGSLIGNRAKTENMVASFVAIGAVMVSFYGGVSLIIYFFLMLDRVADISSFLPWGFVNIRYWSHVATWLIPLLPLAALAGPMKSQRVWRFFISLGAALWWWIVFLSASRGTIVAVFFGVILAAVLIGRPAWPWLKVFFSYLVFGVITWLLLSVILPWLLLDDVNVRSFNNQSSISVRVIQIVESWRMSLHNFPFGMGSQSWLTHEILTDEYRTAPKYAHPHNMYLMWAAEYGWFLIGTLIIFVAHAILLFWRRRCQLRADSAGKSALYLSAFTASVSAGLLHAGVSAVFIAPGSMLVGLVVLTIFWSLITPQRTRSDVAGNRSNICLMVAVAVLINLSCYLWVSGVIRYYNAMNDDKVFYAESVTDGSMPRFWVHGNYPRHPNQMPSIESTE